MKKIVLFKEKEKYEDNIPPYRRNCIERKERVKCIKDEIFNNKYKN